MVGITGTANPITQSDPQGPNDPQISVDYHSLDLLRYDKKGEQEIG
jgi:hypothetical protein